MDADFAGFIALGALILGLFAWLRADMRRMEERLRDDARRTEERLRTEIAASEERLRADMAGLESRTEERFERLEAQVDARFERLEARMAAMEHGQAKLEGLLEGLREAIAWRARQAAE